MLLRDFLNEFQLDWAQAPVRSEQIRQEQLKGAKVVLVGEQAGLQEAIAWSFLAWNDEKKLNIRVEEALFEEGELQPGRSFTGEVFPVSQADYVVLTGYCCRRAALTPVQTVEYLQSFAGTVSVVTRTGCRRLLLLSDGRVYGKLEDGFAASEYEAGRNDTEAPGFEAQYLLQAMEGILVSAARTAGASYNILRTGLLYGAGIPMLDHEAAVMAKKTAAGEKISLHMSPRRSSYISIHDFLTALQFVLTVCPDNKILNASGLDSDQSGAELMVHLYQNFPNLCRVSLEWDEADRNGADRSEAEMDDADQDKVDRNGAVRDGEAGATEEPDSGKATGDCAEETAETICKLDTGGDRVSQELQGILLNTQLIRHYGFQPAVSMEDGLIILVKALQDTGEVFIFDNTYFGKLEKVQQILLGYLLEIDRICRKHDIKYFLAGGTLLGAIRHHGFIPWDDDADVMMLREDYDKFRQVAEQELPDHIFFQLPYTEKGNHNPFTKLRINNTMFATEFTGHFMDMHNGIFFDVLSHDRTGNHRWSQKLHLMITMFTRSVVFNKWGNTDIKSGGNHPVICKIVDKLKYLIPMRLAEWAQNRSLEFFKNRETEYLYDGMGRNLKRGPFPKKWLEETVYVDFEGCKFPVPKEYDKYLTYLYGDYMQMIPVSQRRTSHSIVLTDLGAYSDFRLEVPQSREP